MYSNKSKAVPLHTIVAFGGRGGVAPIFIGKNIFLSALFSDTCNVQFAVKVRNINWKNCLLFSTLGSRWDDDEHKYGIAHRTGCETVFIIQSHFSFITV
jgi:hypothetical protein